MRESSRVYKKTVDTVACLIKMKNDFLNSFEHNVGACIKYLTYSRIQGIPLVVKALGREGGLFNP